MASGFQFVIKTILKSLFFVILGGIILFFMVQYELLDLSKVGAAFETGQRYLAFAVLSCTSLLVLTIIRYTLLLRNFDLSIRHSQTTAATCVSIAAGQWLPGSMAVAEVIRVGLMLGAVNADSDSNSKKSLARSVDSKPAERAAEGDQFSGAGKQEAQAEASDPSPRSRVTVASFVDRAIGLLVIFSFGGIISSSLLIGQLQDPTLRQEEQIGLVLLAAFTISASLGIISLPLIARSDFLRSGVHWLRGQVNEHKIHHESLESRFALPVLKALLKIFHVLSSVRASLVSGTARPLRLVLPVLVSIGCLFMLVLSFYFSALATGQELSLLSITAAFPIMAISQLLPIGIGGIGGHQLVAVAVFKVFAVSASVVSAASLVQSSLWLAVVTVFGLIFAQISAGQIRSILSNLKNEPKESLESSF